MNARRIGLQDALGLLLVCCSAVGCEPKTQPSSSANEQLEESVTDSYCTLGAWRVKEGREADFIAAWKAVGEAFFQLSRPPGPGTLLRSVSDPSFFYSFGPWDRLEDIQAMRDDPRARAAIARLVDLCIEASPGTFRVVAEARDAPAQER